MIPPTMKDPRLERVLDRDGYLRMPRLALDDLELVRRVYATAPVGPARETVPASTPAVDREWLHQMAPGEGWRISTDECVPEDRIRLKNEMAPVWERIADEVFVDHEVVQSSFLVKHPGPDSVLPLHQDPNVVDEHDYRAVTAWIALDDITVDVDNGPMHVLPGSHRAGYEWRGTRTVPTYINDLEALWAHSIPIDVAAGDVLIMDGRLLHGSPPNRSDRPRGAIAGMFAPRGAPLCHAVSILIDRVEVRRVDADFFLQTSYRSLRASVPDEYPVVATAERAESPLTADVLIAQQRYLHSWRGRARRWLDLR